MIDVIYIPEETGILYVISSPTVPDIGELVNLYGEDHVVTARYWTIDPPETPRHRRRIRATVILKMLS